VGADLLANLQANLRAIVGAEHVLTGAACGPFLTDWRGRYTGAAQAVVRPASTAQVAAVVALAAAGGVPIVPQGGNTGLVGGATPDATGNAIVLSLARLNRLRSLDPLNNTLVAEAGMVLQTVQQHAQEAGRLFPLSLASQGSATLGGNLATNAGGTQVLRYGNARELCLGLEVVTADGQVWDGLNALRKNNTGYDLRDLFIGAEGTLGIITAACMKLFPMPRAQGTALAALASLDDALRLLDLAQQHCGPTLTTFEVFNDLSLQLVERHFAPRRSPFGARHPQYVLLEISDHEDQAHALGLVEHLFERALQDGLVQDVVLAQSSTQRQQFWALRELISEAQAAEGKNIKHDISLPISGIGRFVTETDALLQSQFPGVRMVTFGHLGDGNLHYNVSPPLGQSHDTFLAQQGAINRLVHDAVSQCRGSISAEHGIGQLKQNELPRYKSAVEMALMARLKAAFDPAGLMNPGKLL
jgi:FAD/FMN-containing dehydrogenase